MVLQNSYINSNEPETILEIEEVVEFVAKLIESTAWKSTPYPSDRQHVVSYPAHIRETIKNKRRLRKIWQRSRFPVGKAALIE